MDTREARIGLTAFALLLAALGVNMLVMQQAAAPSGNSKSRVERSQTAAADKGRRGTPAATAPTAGTAGGLTRAPVAADSEGAETIRAIQRELQAKGYETGSTDGMPGLMTRAAIMAYEHDNRLPLTAEPNEDTLRRILLGASAGEGEPRGGSPTVKPGAEAVIRTVQQTLSGLGYNTGKVDGRLGEDTQRAIRDFEIDNRMPETGRISGTMIARLARAAGNGRLPVTR
jgi:peptidoglycan hydrolase-like protein with peptidoglycan-binding domain